MDESHPPQHPRPLKTIVIAVVLSALGSLLVLLLVPASASGFLSNLFLAFILELPEALSASFYTGAAQHTHFGMADFMAVGLIAMYLGYVSEAFVKDSKVISLSALILGMFFILVGCFSFAKSGLGVSFDQNLAAIAPYIAPKEEQQLRSQWALMKNRTDYEQITTTLKARAAAAHITLPQP